MGMIRLSSDDVKGSTILSNTFIDHYMPQADGIFVKVYLYLLRVQQSNRQLSDFSAIADHLGCSDNDVERSIRYWISKGLIRYEVDEKNRTVDITLCQPKDPEPVSETPRIVDYLRVVRPEEDPIHAASAADPYPDAFRAATPRLTADTAPVKSGAPSGTPEKKTVRRLQPSAQELAQALSDKEFIELKKEAEAFFDRSLTQKDINVLWLIHQDLALPFDLCEYLLEYCASDKENHPERMQSDYYKKIATSWADQGIRTREEAMKDTARHFFGTQILRALGVQNRYTPTPAELRMVETWRKELGFSDEMILLACDEAILTKPGSANFRYINGILSSWHKDGIHTPEKLVERANSQKKMRTDSSKSGKNPSGNDAPFLQGSLSSDLDYLEKLAMKDIKNS